MPNESQDITLRTRVTELEAERETMQAVIDRLAGIADGFRAERDALSAKLRAAGEQLEAARDQHGYLVSAAAFDEVCEERDALAKKLSVSPAVRELADNICRNISKAQQHVFCNSEIEPDGDMLDLLNHMETLAQQIAFDSGDSVAAPVPPSQEARDAERYRFLLGRVDGDKAQTLFERELDAAILAAKEKK